MLQHTFRALRSSNYRIFISGQAISQIGTWMQRTGVSWVVYEMTGSTFMLGLTVFASQFPSFLFSLYGGVLSDRYNRQRLTTLTQTASMLQAIALAVLVFSGAATVWQILLLSVVLGIINAFDVPARQALVNQLVDHPEDLSNALALSSSVVNIARLIGPALSGFVLAQWGAGICFFINAVSFLAVIVSLLLLKPLPQSFAIRREKISEELKESFHYLKTHTVLAPVMLYISIVSFLIIPFDTLLPELAKLTYHGDAKTYGYIYSSMGLGALAGTFFLASLKSNERLGLILVVNTLLLAFGLIGFSFVLYLPVALVFSMVAGFGSMTQTTICLTIIQTRSDPKMRGRIVSYFAMALFGMLPLGGLLIGGVSQRIGSPLTMQLQGAIAVVIAVLFYQWIKKTSNNRKSHEEQAQKQDQEIRR